MTCSVQNIASTRLAERAGRFPVSLQNWRALLSTWLARARQRQALAALDDRLLDDVGISREAARRECARPFWRSLAGHSDPNVTRLRGG